MHICIIKAISRNIGGSNSCCSIVQSSSVLFLVEIIKIIVLYTVFWFSIRFNEILSTAVAFRPEIPFKNK